MSKTRIGLGLAAIGRPEYLNLRQDSDDNKSETFYKENAMKIMDHAYVNGLRDFDTAPSYGKGEKYLMEWNDQHRYADVNLSTKWGYTYVADWEIGYVGAHEIKEHTLEKLMEQWSFSKQLLPGLKIYQIHSATFESGVLENQSVLQKLDEIKKQTGIILGISVSGERQNELLEFASSIKINEVNLFDSFQVTYNILETSTHQTVVNLINANKTVIIKEALANGRVFKNENYPHYNSLYNSLNQMSVKYGVSTDAIALRFIVDHLEPTLVLSGASTVKQLDQNMGALKISLEKSDLELLSQYTVPSESYWNERKKLEWN